MIHTPTPRESYPTHTIPARRCTSDRPPSDDELEAVIRRDDPRLDELLEHDDRRLDELLEDPKLNELLERERAQE